VRILYRLAIALLAALLAGCGFALRGAPDLPADVRSVAIDARSGLLADEVEVYLREAGAALVASREQADAVLDLGREHFEERVVSVDSETGKEREFELAYTVNCSLRDRDGKTLVGPQTVSLLRDYVFDPERVIGASREQSVLREEMRRDAAQEILRRIDAAFSE